MQHTTVERGTSGEEETVYTAGSKQTTQCASTQQRRGSVGRTFARQFEFRVYLESLLEILFGCDGSNDTTLGECLAIDRVSRQGYRTVRGLEDIWRLLNLLCS